MSKKLNETLEQLRIHFQTAAEAVDELLYLRTEVAAQQKKIVTLQSKCDYLQSKLNNRTAKINNLFQQLHETNHAIVKAIPVDANTVILWNVDKELLNKQRLSLSDVLHNVPLTHKQHEHFTGLIYMLDAWYDEEYPPA